MRDDCFSKTLKSIYLAKMCAIYYPKAYFMYFWLYIIPLCILLDLFNESLYQITTHKDRIYIYTELTKMVYIYIQNSQRSYIYIQKKD